MPVPVVIAARRGRARGPARSGRGEQLRLDPPAARAIVPPAPAPDLPASPAAREADQRPHGGLTLDDLLVGVWEGLSAGEEVTCPVCRSGALAREPADGRRATIVRCPDCGSRLA